MAADYCHSTSQMTWLSYRIKQAQVFPVLFVQKVTDARRKETGEQSQPLEGQQRALLREVETPNVRFLL